MKNLKIFLLFALAIFTSCDLDEAPPYLDENAYNDPMSILATLDGVYAGLANYNAQERRLFVQNGFSGFFNTRKQGPNINNVNNRNLFSLKPQANDGDAEAMWLGFYSAIARANTLIANVQDYDPDGVSPNDILFKEVVGQSHFVRAWSYFSLVRLFGDVPLILDLPSHDAVMNALAPAKEVYAQIIADCTMAADMMNGGDNPNYYYPKKYAANMLLAKVYMTMASNEYANAYDIIPDDFLGSNFWQMSYDQAIQVLDHYQLVPDYASLFTLEGENSTESIFELQISQIATNSQMGRNYTPNNYKPGQCFGWFTVGADFYDDHLTTYPGDPRLEGATYMSEYTNNGNNPNNVGNWVRTYPSRNRGWFGNSHPYFFKFANKDITHSNQYDSKNIIVYRYADLLLMLAEISNELGDSANALNYVTQVLDRSGLSNANYASADQATFRDKIMKEYRYELLGEGEDAHNNRRRGFNYFLENIIIPHNPSSWHPLTPNRRLSDGQAMNFNNKDLTLSEDPSQIMFLPLPTREINTNDLIN
tara:strand:- start:154 stop:1758 length:1605 start_codon:yes stop_codon:yes gene_type:complete